MLAWPRIPLARAADEYSAAAMGLPWLQVRGFTVSVWNFLLGGRLCRIDGSIIMTFVPIAREFPDRDTQ